MSVVTESIQQETEHVMPDETHDEVTPAERDAAPSSSDRLVPVNEAIRYRKRAQAAEQALAQMQSELESARQRYEQAEQSITSLERRQRIDALLSEADAVDVEAARLLTEAAIQSMSEPDVAEAVADLRRHKPYLFRDTSQSTGGLALAPQIDGLDEPLAKAAEQAQHSGDRRDLLRYLRLRRRP